MCFFAVAATAAAATTTTTNLVSMSYASGLGEGRPGNLHPVAPYPVRGFLAHTAFAIPPHDAD